VVTDTAAIVDAVATSVAIATVDQTTTSATGFESTAPQTSIDRRLPALPRSSSDALAATLAGLPDTLTATLGSTPDNVPYSKGEWLHVQMEVADNSPVQQVLGTWQAAVLLGAVADRTATNEQIASVIKGMDIAFVQPDGAINSGLQPTNPDIVAGQSFGPVPDDHTVRADVTALLAGYGLEAVSIEIQHPLDAALKVIATAPSADAVAGRLSELHAELLGTPYRYEGVYLELRLANTESVAAVATAVRTGQTSQWVRPDLAGLIGAYVFSTTPPIP